MVVDLDNSSVGFHAGCLESDAPGHRPAPHGHKCYFRPCRLRAFNLGNDAIAFGL